MLVRTQWHARPSNAETKTRIFFTATTATAINLGSFWDQLGILGDGYEPSVVIGSANSYGMVSKVARSNN